MTSFADISIKKEFLYQAIQSAAPKWIVINFYWIMQKAGLKLLMTKENWKSDAKR